MLEPSFWRTCRALKNPHRLDHLKDVFAFEISGAADALDPEVGAYELFQVGAGKTMSGSVDVTLKDDPAGMWKVKVGPKGISLVYRTGLMLIFR